MADYSQPYQPNMLNNVAAANNWNTLSNQQQLTSDLKDAGQMAASGDMAGAQNQLLSQGHLEQVTGLQKIAGTMKENHLNDLKDTYAKVGGLARMVLNEPDPAKRSVMWGQALSVAKSHNMDTTDFEDPTTGPQRAVAFAGKVDDVINDEKARREAELARFKGATTYQGTMMGPDGLPKVGPDGKPVPATRQYLQTGEWTPPVAVPPGVDLSEPVVTGGKVKSPKEFAIDHATKNVVDGAAARYGVDPKEVPKDLAQAAAAGRAVLELNGDKWQLKNPDGSIGDIRQRGVSAAERRATVSEQRINPEVMRELKEYETIGKKDGDLAQRKSIAGGALNHLETVAQISDGSLENALGVIQGYGGYQKFQDALNSGRVNDSVAYHNAKQTLTVLLREIENSYHIAGTGADTDARLKGIEESFSPQSMLQSPNIDVFRQRLNNMRAILQGVINSPRPSAFGSRASATAGSAAAETEVRRVSGQPETGGQVQRLAPAIPPRPANVPPGSAWNAARQQFRTPDGTIIDANGQVVP